MLHLGIEQRIERWYHMSCEVENQWRHGYTLPAPRRADVIRAEQDARDLVADLRRLAFLIERDADLVYDNICQWEVREGKKS